MIRSIVLGFVIGLMACAPTRATREQCEHILDRIVAIELRELGYRDPELIGRKQTQLRARFAPQLEECVGRRVPRGAMACIEHAEDTETLTHECLRR